MLNGLRILTLTFMVAVLACVYDANTYAGAAPLTPASPISTRILADASATATPVQYYRDNRYRYNDNRRVWGRDRYYNGNRRYYGRQQPFWPHFYGFRNYDRRDYGRRPYDGYRTYRRPWYNDRW